MARPTLTIAGAIVLCSVASAQQRIDPARMFPITGRIKDAGTIDVTTGKWTKPSQAGTASKALGTQTSYNNTCTWTGGGFYAGFESCEWNFDEGRVPSTSDPAAPVGAVDNNVMESFQFSYCTNVPTATIPSGYDMELAFYDKNNGNCVGGLAQQPPPVSTQATAYFDLAGLGLPGSPSCCPFVCWIVTANVSNSGWVMASDGEGTFDNDPANDKFIWAQAQNTTTTALGAPPDGFAITAEPSTGGYGACSYSIPCGIDVIFGNTCGTGLDTWDASWINVDGAPVGIATPSAGCPNSFGPIAGTNCYYFGGYAAGNPFASYWMVLKARGGVSPIYCTARTTSCGTVPSVGGPAGAVSLSGGAGSFTVTNGLCPDSPLGLVGVLIHTFNGRNPTPPFLAFGFLCINAPLFRGPATSNNAGGLPPCDSTYTWDFGAYAAANAGTMGLIAGNTLDIQPWSRDPANTVNPPGGNANLSNSLATTIVP